MKSKSRYKFLTMLFGLLTAGAVVLSQAFYFQASELSKKASSEQNEDTDQSDESDSFFSIPDSSIPSTFSVELNQELSFVLEILFNTDQDDETCYVPAISTGQLFHTLFSALISPNAP